MKINKKKVKKILKSLFDENKKPIFAPINDDDTTHMIKAKCSYCDITSTNLLSNKVMTCSNCYESIDFGMNSQIENIENMIKMIVK